MLGHHWEPAEGRCIDTRWAGSGGSDGTDHTHWLMEVRPLGGGEPFRFELGYPGFHENFRGPGMHQTVRMECDVKRQKARWDLADPDLSWKAARDTKKATFAAELAAPVGQPAAVTADVHLSLRPLGRIVADHSAAPEPAGPSAPPHAAAEPAIRLRKLAELHDEGLLTDSEYERQRQRIVDEL